jgi:hypothetical protein
MLLLACCCWHAAAGMLLLACCCWHAAAGMLLLACCCWHVLLLVETFCGHIEYAAVLMRAGMLWLL